MHFDWDEKKNKSNWQKHSVNFEAAKLIFDDPNVFSTLDKRFKYTEERWHSIGLAAGTVLLFVANTMEKNQNDNEIIRIISARKATKHEQQRYLQRHP